MKFQFLEFVVICTLSFGFVSQARCADVAAKMDTAMPGMHDMPKAQSMPGMSIFNLNGRWTTQDGVTVPLGSLRGEPLVAAMIYTHCRDVCPLIAERMQDVERRLPAGKRGSVRFALFSLDWARDRPEQLRRFASAHRLDLRHWTVLGGNESAVRELSAALGVSFYRAANGDYQHSLAIFVLDSDGVVRSQQDDLQRAPQLALAALRSLLSRP